MTLLLDTNALLWFALDLSLLGTNALGAANVALERRELAVSSISFWEVALKTSKGKLALDRDPADFRRDVLRNGVVEIALGGAAAVDAPALPDLPPDPGDRFIVATARSIGATLLTSDRRILAWPGALARIDARL